MNKQNLEFILQLLINTLETKAHRTHIEEFKKKYRGVKWEYGLKKSILLKATSTLWLQQWINNLITFMIENGISIDVGSRESSMAK